MDPTLAGFAAFITGVMGITAAQLPPTSPYIGWAFNVALNTVNQALQQNSNANTADNTLYALAVYNLAGDRLINFAQDQPGLTTFSDLRKGFKINSFVGGVISSASDQGTSESLVVPDWAKNLTIADLNSLQTPYGRTYLGIAQSYGPTIWGLS